jgi:alternate signal-mediated exported protein
MENRAASTRVHGLVLSGIIGLTGMALLVGGVTFAEWSVEKPNRAGEILAGNLDLDVAADAKWYDITANREDGKAPVTIDGKRGHAIPTIGAYRIIPGDSVRGEIPFAVALGGDNMVSKLSLELPETATNKMTTLTVKYSIIALNDAGTAINTSALGATDGFYAKDKTLNVVSKGEPELAFFAPGSDKADVGGADDTAGITTTVPLVKGATNNFALLIDVAMPFSTSGQTDANLTDNSVKLTFGDMKVKLKQVQSNGNWSQIQPAPAAETTHA